MKNNRSSGVCKCSFPFVYTRSSSKNSTYQLKKKKEGVSILGLTAAIKCAQRVSGLWRPGPNIFSCAYLRETVARVWEFNYSGLPAWRSLALETKPAFL